MKLLIPSIAITSLLITSCSTTESFVNDDIYSVRPSELPIGESLTDETSYASFKSRKLGKTNDRMTYADEMALRNRQNCLDQWTWYDGCGCSYREWTMYSRYSYNNRFNNMNRMIYWNHPSMAFGFAMSNRYPYGISYGMYSGNMYPYHHSPYIMMDPWYGGYGYGYGWNYPYNGYYGYNPYSPYGYYGYGGYGYGGNMNGWSNSSNHSGVSSNVIRGPRGTSSGYSNPSGRAVNYDKVQVGQVTTPSSAKGNLSSSRTAVTKPVESKSVISRVNTSTYSRDRIDGSLTPSTSSRTNVERVSSSPSRSSVASPVSSSPSRNNTMSSSPSRNTNSEYQRTYPSRTSSPSGTLRPESATGRSNTISTPQRTSSPDNGSYSSPSRGSSNSGMGSSSSGSGGGRSGASSSSGSSTGRR